MTLRIENPCGVGIPSWPRLLKIPCAAAYAGRSVGWIEAKLRSGDIPYLLDEVASERVIDRLELDRWVDAQPKRTGKLREPRQATLARVGVA